MTQSKDLESTYSEKVRENKDNKESKDNTPLLHVFCSLLWDRISEVMISSHTPRELAKHHEKSCLSRCFQNFQTTHVLHLWLPTISVDGEITPRPFEGWSDTNCIAEYFKVKIHPWRGAVCGGFDKAEFTNTEWESTPKFCYISLNGALTHCKGTEMPRQDLLKFWAGPWRGSFWPRALPNQVKLQE